MCCCHIGSGWHCYSAESAEWLIRTSHTIVSTSCASCENTQFFQLNFWKQYDRLSSSLLIFPHLKLFPAEQYNVFPPFGSESIKLPKTIFLNFCQKSIPVIKRNAHLTFFLSWSISILIWFSVIANLIFRDRPLCIASINESFRIFQQNKKSEGLSNVNPWTNIISS